jgi:hypothetical protein
VIADPVEVQQIPTSKVDSDSIPSALRRASPHRNVLGLLPRSHQWSSSTVGLLEERLRAESTMLFTIAFALLAAWLFGLLGMYPAGDLFHVLLLVGLLLLLLAFLRARDAANRRVVGGDPDRP